MHFFLTLFWTSGLPLWASDLLCLLAHCLVSKKVSVEHCPEPFVCPWIGLFLCLFIHVFIQAAETILVRNYNKKSGISTNTMQYTLLYGLTYNTRGYFASCVVFFLTPEGQGKLQVKSKMSARTMYYTLNHTKRDLLFHLLCHFLVVWFLVFIQPALHWSDKCTRLMIRTQMK